MNKIVLNIKSQWQKIEFAQGIILFFVVMFVSNLLWKISLNTAEESNQAILFGQWNISFLFTWAVNSTAVVTQKLLSLFQFPSILISDNTLFISNRACLTIIWGCTAIKQSFIFLCIMLFARGEWKHKLWFIPLCLILIYGINILRAFVLGVGIYYNPKNFDFLHGFVLKYIFYLILFLFWVFWEEKLVTKVKK